VWLHEAAARVPQIRIEHCAEHSDSKRRANNAEHAHMDESIRYLMPTDPAEEHGYLRYFYRNRRPTRIGRIWNSAYAWVAGLGLLPKLLVTLQIKSRLNDRMATVILVAASYGGERYLVSMLGNESEWVRNVRAAAGAAYTKRGRRFPVMLVEIPPEQRAPILKAWSQQANSGRKHLTVKHDAPVADFAAIANDHPVFRIDSVRQTT
jgi:hypothetical protein